MMFNYADNSYARLPERFFARVSPTKVRAPRLVKLNHPLAAWLGLDPSRLDSAEGAQLLAGNVVPEGAEPLAMAYAGHQFGGFVPQLGDGRAILLGERVALDGTRREIQLKGAGPTPYSRQGDGRAALGPVLREYIVSEAMAALGVPTTRALAAVLTGEPVMRDGQLLPGAVFTRVAASHLRIGTFEFFAARRDRDALVTLTAYALARHYPGTREPLGDGDSDGDDSGDRGGGGGDGRQHQQRNDALSLLDRVVEAQASLVARWLGVGFIHGVMNTDNTAISGETIDYGPCAFLDEYLPGQKFSSIDRGGRYAFANQPRIAQWNLARLAEALLPLIADNEEAAAAVATRHLARFPAAFDLAYARVMHAKLGLVHETDDDRRLAADLLERLASNHVDYTIFFRALCASAESSAADERVAALFDEPGAFHDWAEDWRRRLRLEDQGTPPAQRARAMRQANPAFIPRNHRVEQAIAAGINGDFAPFETLVEALARPYEDQPALAHLAEPPRPDERVRHTFCGT